MQELKLFSCSRKGHYIGNTTDLEIVVTGLVNVQEGDSLEIAIKDIYNEIDILNVASTIHKHTIPSKILSSLDIDDYLITAALHDGQQSGCLSYRVVPTPTVSFVNLSPNELQIPMNAPISITGQWNIQGEQMNSISGSGELVGLSAIINQLN